MRGWWMVVAVVAALTAKAAADPAVTAVVTYERVDEGADGVTRTAVWRERMWRAGGQVWIERIRPGAGTGAGAGAGSIKQIDLGLAARWYVRDGAGVKAALVAGPQQVVIDLAPGDVADLGLDTRWALAAGLVDRSDPRVRVTWSERWALPLRVDAASPDGRTRTRIRVVPSAPAPGAVWPWQRAAGYSHRDRSDLED